MKMQPPKYSASGRMQMIICTYIYIVCRAECKFIYIHMYTYIYSARQIVFTRAGEIMRAHLQCVGETANDCALVISSVVCVCVYGCVCVCVCVCVRVQERVCQLEEIEDRVCWIEETEERVCQTEEIEETEERVCQTEEIEEIQERVCQTEERVCQTEEIEERHSSSCLSLLRGGYEY